jgi:hypothetical protein
MCNKIENALDRIKILFIVITVSIMFSLASCSSYVHDPNLNPTHNNPSF